MKKGLEVGIKTIGIFVLMLVFTTVAVFLFPIDGLIGQEVAMIAAVLFFYYMFDRKSDWSLGLKESLLVRKFIGGALLGILMITIAFGVIWLLGGLQVVGVRWNFVTSSKFAYWFILFALVAIAEEILSRGYQYGLIKHLYSRKVAVVISSILFALLHSMNQAVWSNPIPMLELFFAGVLFALLREVTGGLWAPIGLHLTWNFFQGPVYGFEVSGLPMSSIVETKAVGNPLLSGGEFGAEGSLVGLVITLLTCLILFRYGKKKSSF